jgi:hypothetical protein
VFRRKRESFSTRLITLEVVVDRVGEGMDLFFLEGSVSIDSIVLFEGLLAFGTLF